MQLNGIAKLVNITQLTPREWNRLASIAGLKADHWGEGWLALHRAAREEGVLTESRAVEVLRGLSSHVQAQVELSELTGGRALAA